MKIFRNPLLNFIGILFLVTTVATMGPNTRVAEAAFTAFETEFDTSGTTPFGPFLENSSAFHFLDPLAPSSGDPSKFDPAYLNYLLVEVCRVDSGGGCTLVKSFSTQTPGSEKLRITTDRYGSFYLVNWETSKSNFSNRATYRVTVSAAGIQLGSIDLTPDIYASFGRTWPIKFLIEKDAALRIRVLAAAGMNLWQVADDLRTEFGICGDDLQQLLLANYPNADADLVAEVVFGVCQEVELFPTTKIADMATRDALAFYDPSTGRMNFVGDTNILKNLKVNDVIVSREGPAAPYGYLRKVTSIRKSKGIYTLETVQAKFTETIKRGTLQVSGPLEPADDTNNADKSQAFAPEGRSAEFDIGKSIPFTRHIDEVINLEGGDDEIGGTGTIRVVGDIDIQAGYNIGAGIELCSTPPFACADRVEAWMGYVHKSSLHVIANFDGHLKKEFAYPIKMSPIFFMIGPIPVWLVPEINVIVGFNGTAHVDFEFKAAAQSALKPYIKWTEDEGWKDLSTGTDLSKTSADVKFLGTAHLEGYAKLDAALLLYGVIGPSMDGSLGIVGDAQTGKSPFWKISGYVQSGIGLRSVFMDLFDVDAHEDLFNFPFEIAQSPNLPPQFSDVTKTFDARMNETIVLGPKGDGFGDTGYFKVMDPEGGGVALSGSSNFATDVFKFENGKLKVTFKEQGSHEIKVTAKDPQGNSAEETLTANVVNQAPEILFTSFIFNFPAEVQYFLTVQANDPETGLLPCSAVKWEVTAPDIKTESVDNRSCTVAVVFKQQGDRNITVTATDPQGKSFSRTRTVNITAPPANPAPVIDVDSFLILAAKAPIDQFYCATGFWCEAPEGATLFNGETGNYHTPLELSLSVSDPQGEPAKVKEWRCLTGPNIYTLAADNGNGTYSCSPFVNGGTIGIFAVVTDGTNEVVSELRTFTMQQRINPN